MRIHSTHAAVIGLVLLSLGALLPAPLLAREARILSLDTFLSAEAPLAEAIFLQRNERFPELGNVEVTVQVNARGLERLQQEDAGESLVLGHGDHHKLFLRDDGTGGDEIAGDGVYTFFARIDEADLVAKAAAEREQLQRDARLEVPAFAGRRLLGTRPLEPFDIAGFEAGERVAFRLGGAAAPPNADFTPGTNAFQDAVLMIRHPFVVQNNARTFDPCTGLGTPLGAWTFGHLMTEIANQPASGIDPSDLTEMWLTKWMTSQTVNGFSVPARTMIKSLILDWRAASGGGKLDLKIAPFRLLAIVPRIDLRHVKGPGMFLDAGEARFVFGVVIPPDYPSNGSGDFIGATPIPGTGGCEALPFSVIFEYGVPICECELIKGWASEWESLLMPQGPASQKRYLIQLERLTRFFTSRNANPLKPNGSALNQLRTNEIALAFPWELREFRLTVFPFSLFEETTTVDTPHDSFNNTPQFTNFITGGARPVPLLFGGAPFLGGNPQMPGPGHFWNGPGIPPLFHNDRFLVSLGTCNDCHAGETNTVFVHVDPSTPVLPANLSGFLTGISVADPAFGLPVRDFDDLERREADLIVLRNTICATVAPGDSPVPPLTGATHDHAGDRQQPVVIALDELLRSPIRQVH